MVDTETDSPAVLPKLLRPDDGLAATTSKHRSLDRKPAEMLL